LIGVLPSGLMAADSASPAIGTETRALWNIKVYGFRISKSIAVGNENLEDYQNSGTYSPS